MIVDEWEIVRKHCLILTTSATLLILYRSQMLRLSFNRKTYAPI